MSRYARRREPNLPRKQRIELGEVNVPLRALLLGIALLVAALAFGSVINQRLAVQSGWQEIEAANPQTVAHQAFQFSYDLGAGEQSAREELRAVTAVYTDALDTAYRTLSGETIEGVSNLAVLNSQPNTAVQVDPALYAALEAVQLSGSRYVYLAPLMQQYDALFACSYDQEAALYDPARDEGAAEFAARIAAFAADPTSIQLELLGEDRVCLTVSAEYLDYAAENELETLVDFGILRNAFLCDAAADALAERGYCRGVVSSLDGYARNLSGEKFGVNLFDRVDGTVTALGSVTYTAPAALVICRAFPASAQEKTRFYTYADGTVVPPYLNASGLPSAAAPNLVTLSHEESVAALALRTVAAFAEADAEFPTLTAFSWASVRDGAIATHGTDFQLGQ